MDEAVRAKLVEVLRLAYGGDVAKVVAHIRAFEAAPAGTRLPAASGRRVTCGEVVVDLIPSVAAPHGGNAVVQFEITVRAESGEAFGIVDCEAAFETMEKMACHEDGTDRADTKSCRVPRRAFGHGCRGHADGYHRMSAVARPYRGSAAASRG